MPEVEELEFTSFFDEEDNKLSKDIEKHFSDESKQTKLLYDEDEEKKGVQQVTILHKAMHLGSGFKESIPKNFLAKSKLTILLTTDNEVDLDEQCRSFEREAIIMKTEYMITKENLVHHIMESDPVEYSKHPRLTSCLVIPQSSGIRVKVAYMNRNMRNTKAFVDKLYPSDYAGQSTLIIFGGAFYRFRRSYLREKCRYRNIIIDALRKIQERFDDDNCTVWGGELPVYYNKKGFNRNQATEKDNVCRCLFACNVYGSAVRSYNCVLTNADYLFGKVNDKLVDFKAQIRFLKYRIGFVNASAQANRPHPFKFCVKKLKKLFPSVKFTYLMQRAQPGDNNCGIIGNNGLGVRFIDECLMSILIITYDDVRIQEPIDEVEEEYVADEPETITDSFDDEDTTDEEEEDDDDDDDEGYEIVDEATVKRDREMAKEKSPAKYCEARMSPLKRKSSNDEEAPSGFAKLMKAAAVPESCEDKKNSNAIRASKKKQPLQLSTIREDPKPSIYDLRLTQPGCNGKPEHSDKLKLALVFTNNESELYTKYCQMFLCDLLIIKAQHLVTNEYVPQLSSAGEEKPFEAKLASALLIRENPSVKVKYAHFSLKFPRDAAAFVKKLIPENDSRSTLLLFGDVQSNSVTATNKCIDTIVEQIKEKFGKNRYIVWGGEVPLFYSKISVKKLYEKDVIFGLNIYGPGVESYSLTLPVMTYTLLNVHLKVTNFRKRIHLKKDSIGLVNICVSVEREEMTDFVIDFLSRTFPKTVLTFSVQLRTADGDAAQLNNRIIGSNSEQKNIEPHVLPECWFSLLIITFDSNEIGASSNKVVDLTGKPEGAAKISHKV